MASLSLAEKITIAFQPHVARVISRQSTINDMGNQAIQSRNERAISALTGPSAADLGANAGLTKGLMIDISI